MRASGTGFLPRSNFRPKPCSTVGDRSAILVEADYQGGPKRGQPRSFEELWAGAIYELHNVTYAREFVRLNDQAEEGKVSKRAFVAGILKYELRAVQQTR